MKPNCLICGTPSAFFMEKDGFDEYLCPMCDLSFVHPQPSADWLRDKVYSYESGYQGNKKANLSLAKEDKRTNKIFDYLSDHMQGGKILDIGCSSGQFLYYAKKRGFAGAGVEINKRTADIARANGFEVYNGFLDASPFEKNSFDVVYLGDVIEHVNEPNALVDTAKLFLNNGGLIIISTPNTDCFWSRSTLAFYRIFGVPWAVATPPHHLLQFSFSNLNRLLRECGFEQKHSIFTGPHSLKYELGSLHLYARWKKDKTVRNFTFMLFSFGIYSVIYAVNLMITLFLKKDFQMVNIYGRGGSVEAG